MEKDLTADAPCYSIRSATSEEAEERGLLGRRPAFRKIDWTERSRLFVANPSTEIKGVNHLAEREKRKGIERQASPNGTTRHFLLGRGRQTTRTEGISGLRRFPAVLRPGFKMLDGSEKME